MSQSAMWEEEAENHGGYQSSSTIHTTLLHTGNKLLIRLIVIIDIALRDEFLYTIHQKNLNNLKKISAVEQIKRFTKLPFNSSENLKITEERRLEFCLTENSLQVQNKRKQFHISKHPDMELSPCWCYYCNNRKSSKS